MNRQSNTPSNRQRLGRWRPFPEEKPEADKDGRHLVVIVQGDMHWIGIRYFHHQGDYWQGQTSSNEEGQWSEYVYWFTPLLDDGERCPPVPNAAEQARDPDQNYHQEHKRRVR